MHDGRWGTLIQQLETMLSIFEGEPVKGGETTPPKRASYSTDPRHSIRKSNATLSSRALTQPSSCRVSLQVVGSHSKLWAWSPTPTCRATLQLVENDPSCRAALHVVEPHSDVSSHAPNHRVSLQFMGLESHSNLSSHAPSSLQIC